LNITNIAAGSKNSIMGADLCLGSLVSASNSGPSRYVDFFSGPGESISKVVLSETGNSTNPGNGFESDNHSYKVPFEFSPGLGILSLGALGAIAQLKSQVQKWKTSLKFNRQQF